ncbi:c-type cytochrome biogenesis protein CcsB [Dendrosporobacter sp. 1207_IL3150]|uniref:c-type cytochrome biogenesis protein CcsB n=1 Tax=Dendrosporobacter sp. 1207_IL3150 TaxID=3084054 RepID=UPI002FD9D733
MDSQLFLAAFFCYFAACGLYIAYVALENKTLVRYARIAVISGFVSNTLALVVRTGAAGRLPFANMYEFGMAFVWGIILFHLYVESRYKNNTIGAFILPVAFVLTGIFALFQQEVRPLMPALKSNWLMAHVATAVIAYGALAVSFALAVMYLWKSKLEDDSHANALNLLLPSLETIDKLVHQAITFAVPFLTLLIITGAIWAEYAWGDYWRWDPKETWSLITWIIYAVYLHGRTALGWKGKKAMNWAVAGFAAVLFTFIGVNLLLPGLHSYALSR